ncbi:serine hydrolase domain-containing protein [Streptomyces olivoreticuli]|uniref:serine hydrolase domain-containing protein n=1 Tax=Streptomyces olivoreticuli TaxID=68246 RepID=UPI0019675808|nr:serine hydrolase domain-containing protein [Streptomyces olivoreticuli]
MTKSQTKTFVAAVVLQLVDEGKVSLDAPIERYLPGVVDGNGYDGNTITIRHLLQHTSGIPTNPLGKAPVNPDGTYTLSALVREGLSHPRLPRRESPSTTPTRTITSSACSSGGSPARPSPRRSRAGSSSRSA